MRRGGGRHLADAYQRAFECDERSAFGGIVAVNRPIDDATVERMVAAAQADVVIAPGYEDGVVEALVGQAQEHPAPRGAGRRRPTRRHLRPITGGFLVQDPHHFAAGRDDWPVVTKRQPTDEPSGPTPSWRGGSAAG